MKTIVKTILAAAGCCGGLLLLGGGSEFSSTSVRADEVSSSAGKPTRGQPAENKKSWGDLQGRFLYGGTSPERTKLTLNKDIEVCSKHQLRSERLIVNKKNRGIANVVIWLDIPRRAKTPPIHSSYAKSAKTDVLLQNDKCRFTPHVCVLRTTQKLLIKNNDSIAHNTAAYLNRNIPFNSVTAIGKTDERILRKSERAPAKISCSIHSWMTGWIVVKDHPYVAVTDQDGRFKIPNLPVGEWTFQVWHEVPEYITHASQGDRVAQWKKGRFKITIAPGDNDHGEWVIADELFR